MRRKRSASRASCLAALVVLSGLLAGCGSWTMFRQGATRTGYNPGETQIGLDNVADLQRSWTGATGGAVHSSPVVSNGVVYILSQDGKLYAFDADGVTGCSGTPNTCAPLWTAAVGVDVIASPAVVGGIVYVVGDKLYAFDAAGHTGCSGTPKTCLPLWSAAGPLSSPAIVNGVVFVGGIGRVYAYDAAGVTGCSGTPKTCAPLWTGETFCGGCPISSPAVANGVVYVPSDEGATMLEGRLYAFDAAGVTGCSGTPTTCAPLWFADTTAPADFGSAAVANGVVYVATHFNPAPSIVGGALYAFDAAGITGCSGTPKRCTQLWTGNIGYSFASPAVAKGLVYSGSHNSKLYAFDAAGVQGCAGTPKTCTPRWTANFGNAVESSAAIANGVLYVGSNDTKLYAFDAAGVQGCAGTPKICTPLFSDATGGAVRSSPAVVNGFVYVGSVDGKLYAYHLP